ncbi:MAG: penicillin-binding protein activator LpoB [Spirochaetaceae bacterium]|jgi:hypothetical protein|nr:penicillin-binding protein activator LpoB [Spirochaetaceae bacterium]
MKIARKFTFLPVLFIALCLVLVNCASGPKVARVSSGTATDLTGEWTGYDVDIVCNDLINQFLESPRVAQFTAQNKRKPRIMVGEFRNENTTGEYIDPSIISKRMQVEILNSGKAEFVADSALSKRLREGAADQQNWASEASAAALAEETGADFLLTGAVKTIRQRADNQEVRQYYVNADVSNYTTHILIWSGENSEIKKVITKPKYKL